MAYVPVPPRPVSFLHTKTTMGAGDGSPYWGDMLPMGPMASMVPGGHHAVSPAPSSLTPPRSEEDYYYQPQPYVHVHAHVHHHGLDHHGLDHHHHHGGLDHHGMDHGMDHVMDHSLDHSLEHGVELTHGTQHAPINQLYTPPVFKNTANKKERRRTQSINNAYADLRDCIPNVPVDTKLSKIKTLRLAASYIAYLAGILESGDTVAAGHGFRAELLTQAGGRRPSRRGGDMVGGGAADCGEGAKSKGRTGWPETVWALELKQEQV